jgi:PAS domain S-box-containing protein
VGYSTEEVMGHSLVQEFITKDYQASVQSVLDRAIDGVETANFEFPLITKAGARIEVLLNATTRRNEHGKVIGVVGIGQDITGKISYPLLWATIRFTKYTQSCPANTIPPRSHCSREGIC